MTRLPPLLAVLLLLGVSPAAAQQPPAQPEPVRLPGITVIGTTPLPALGVPLDKYPGNVRSLGDRDLLNDDAVDLSDTLERRLGSVSINSSQGNPWQNDVTYRGFLASPLTGSPIGLSVYLDGMRFNDGFGDTMNWDLIPRRAIAGIDVIPGSNPIFGLNTLGGALAVRTKTGRDYPGTTFGPWGGSYGRWAVEAEHGGFRGPVDWYVAFNHLNDDGWRDRSPSDLRQAFTTLGWEWGPTTLHLTYAYANNELVGNGLAPQSLLAVDRSAVHTFPDRTLNEMHLGNLRVSHKLSDSLLLSANGFYRDYRRRTLNGDAEVVCVDDATGEQVFDANGRLLHLGSCSGSAVGFFDSAGNALAGGLERQAEGEDRTTKTRTADWGLTLQLSYKSRILDRGNQLTVGVAYDRHATRFGQQEAEADLVAFGRSVGTRRTGPFETEADVSTRQENVGAYFTDTLDLTETLALTLAGRYQHVSVKIRDRSGENPELRGDHRFDRFSPAAGLAWRPTRGLGVFASYSEGFRAPTPAELACADPDAPCNLPNAFVADPPLTPVVARTYELGLRGRLFGKALEWTVAGFRTDLKDDILFTTVQTGGGGFFQNVGQTRRQGVEAGVSGEWRRLRYSLSYAYVESTYESGETLASVTEPNGVRVSAGDQIPGIPRHGLKAGAEVAVLKNLWLGADLIATSGSYLRGDDANRRAPLDGYAIVNLHARWEPIRHLDLWARVDNVTDAEYETGGAVNFNAFATPIAVERFVAPGPPVSAWAGARVRF